MRGWQFWIDRGGTFTDVIGRAPDGRLHVRKVLSRPVADSRGDPGLGVIDSILDEGTPQGCDEPSGGGSRTLAALKVGTTVATNALLERIAKAGPTSSRDTSCDRSACMPRYWRCASG